MGDSMSGYSRTGSRHSATRPSSRIARLITVASTGRWIEISLSFIALLLCRCGGGGTAARSARSDRHHDGTREELLVAGTHDHLPGCEAAHDLDAGRVAV